MKRILITFYLVRLNLKLRSFFSRISSIFIRSRFDLINKTKDKKRELLKWNETKSLHMTQCNWIERKNGRTERQLDIYKRGHLSIGTRYWMILEWLHEGRHSHDISRILWLIFIVVFSKLNQKWLMVCVVLLTCKLPHVQCHVRTTSNNKNQVERREDKK